MTPEVSDAIGVFSALGDPTRCEIVRYLAMRGSSTATELAARYGVTRQAISKHLAVLGAATIVQSERSGRERRYRLEIDGLTAARRWIDRTEALWDEALGRLERYLEDE